MATKAEKLRSKVSSLHLQAHNYPSRREIIEKCESGSFHPILKNKGRGRSLAAMKESERKYRENYARAFGHE